MCTTVSWSVTCLLKFLVNHSLLSIWISTSNTDYRSVINRQTDRYLIKLDTELYLTCYATKNNLLSTTEVQTNTGIEIPLTYRWSPVPIAAVPVVESCKISASTTEDTEASLSILIRRVEILTNSLHTISCTETSSPLSLLSRYRCYTKHCYQNEEKLFHTL